MSFKYMLNYLGTWKNDARIKQNTRSPKPTSDWSISSLPIEKRNQGILVAFSFPLPQT